MAASELDLYFHHFFLSNSILFFICSNILVFSLEMCSQLQLLILMNRLSHAEILRKLG